MSKDHSFDIVSQVDLQEVTNAVEQARKEILTRYDFKGSQSVIDWNRTEKKVTLQTESEMRMKAIKDSLTVKFAKRNVSLKAIKYGPEEKASGGSVRQVLTIEPGIPKETAKEIVKLMKDSKIKVQAQIQEDQVRVQSAKIDFLQEAIQLLKTKTFDTDLQFINYR